MITRTAVSRRNEDTWHASAAALYAGEIEAFLAFWEPDGEYAVAYPVAGVPPVVTGREAIGALFTGFGAAAAWIAVRDVRFHATADPDVAFVEERMTAELHDGSPYENDLCLRVRFSNGRIASIFEYYGERAHEDLLRRLGFSAAGAAR